MSWQLSYGDLIWSLLKLDDLLVDKLTTLVYNNIRVHRTAILSRHCLPVAYPRERDTGKATSDGQGLRLMTVSALDVECRSF